MDKNAIAVVENWSLLVMSEISANCVTLEAWEPESDVAIHTITAIKIANIKTQFKMAITILTFVGKKEQLPTRAISQTT